MNRIAQSIKNRLSLRPPQADSLNILAELTDKLTLKKHTPCPSPEGNKMGISQEGNEHTPNPSKERNKKVPSSEGKQGCVGGGGFKYYYLAPTHPCFPSE